MGKSFSRLLFFSRRVNTNVRRQRLNNFDLLGRRREAVCSPLHNNELVVWQYSIELVGVGYRDSLVVLSVYG